MAAAIKKRETNDILKQLTGGRFDKRINLVFQAFEKNKRKDPDNIYAIFVKFFLDALKAKGMIENDGQKQIGRITLEPPQIGEPRFEVAITYEKE